MKEMSEELKVDIRIRILARAFQLYEENEKLKRELASRRRQADVWRKKAKAVTKVQRPVSGIQPPSGWVYSLGLDERTVCEFAYGMHGRPKLGPADIAKEMKLSNSAVSKLRTSVFKKLWLLKEEQMRRLKKNRTQKGRK